MNPSKIYSKQDIEDELDIATGHWWIEVVVNNIRQIDLMNLRVDEFINSINIPEKIVNAQVELKLFLFQLNHGFYNDYYEHDYLCALNTQYKLRIDYSIKKFTDALALIDSVLSSSSGNMNLLKNTPSYIFSREIILKIYNKFNGDLWEDMEFIDFIYCFDINNKPLKCIKITKGNGKNFGYILTKSDDHGLIEVNEKIALSCFGIKNYRQMKSELKNEQHTNIGFKRHIDKIFT